MGQMLAPNHATRKCTVAAKSGRKAINGTFGQLDAVMVGPVAEAMGAVTTIMERGMGRVARVVGDMVRSNEFEFKRLRDIASSILDDIASDMLRVGVVAPLSELLRGGLTGIFGK